MKKTDKKPYASPEMDIQYFVLQDILSSNPLTDDVPKYGVVDDDDTWGE